MEKKPLEAYYLADDGDYGRNWFPAPASAWWYDGRGAKELERNYAPYSISNERGEAPTGMTRELRKTAHGVVTVFASVNIKSGFDGLFIRLYDLEGNDAAVIYTKTAATTRSAATKRKSCCLRSRRRPACTFSRSF